MTIEAGIEIPITSFRERAADMAAVPAAAGGAAPAEISYFSLATLLNEQSLLDRAAKEADDAAKASRERCAKLVISLQATSGMQFSPWYEALPEDIKSTARNVMGEVRAIKQAAQQGERK